MKKDIKKTWLLVLFMAVAISAQTQVWLSGSVFHEKGDLGTFGDITIKSNTLLIPRIGYSFNNWIIGIEGGITRGKFSSDETSSKGWTMGVFARRLKRFNNYFGFWGEVQVKYDDSGIKSSFSQLDTYTQQVSFRPGILFFLNKHLSMEASFGNVGMLRSRIKANYINFPRGDFEWDIDRYGLNLNGQNARFGVNWLF